MDRKGRRYWRKFGVASGRPFVRRQRHLQNVDAFPHFTIQSCGTGLKFKVKVVDDGEHTSKQVEDAVEIERGSVYQDDTMTPSTAGMEVEKCKPTGFRLIQLGLLQEHYCRIASHTIQCEKCADKVRSGEQGFHIVDENPKKGLASYLHIQCQGCLRHLYFGTSPQMKMVTGQQRHEVNVRAVWGSMTTGGGAAHLAECMATLDAPKLGQTSFTAIENETGNWWMRSLKEDILQAAIEERQLAMEGGLFDEGVPAITVIWDGGWNKRSHKHSYNALGGVGVIFGARTGQLLHIGIRNKSCYICSVAVTAKREPADRQCFKNWNESSQAMEVDAIVEGFQLAEETHGVRYMKMIGDGDSSVYSQIQEKVAVWGCRVEKLECANHACKCVRNSLEKLVVEKPQFKGRGKLTKKVKVRLVSAVRCAIRMRSGDDNVDGSAVRQLDTDIRNSVHHIFGDHRKCSDFCKEKDTSQIPKKNEVAGHPTGEVDTHFTDITNAEDEADPADHMLQSQSAFWKEGNSPVEELESRKDSGLSPSSLDDQMLKEINIILDRLALKSKRLFGNFTTNLAESWMNVRTKLDGGKFHNRCARGSRHARCYGGALRNNLGVSWSPAVWEMATGIDAGDSFHGLYVQRRQQLVHARKYDAKPEVKTRKWKRKLEAAKESSSKRARLAYGENTLDVVPDRSAEALAILKDNFYKEYVNLSEDKISATETLTKEQSQSTLWHTERRQRLTASNFADVAKRNPSRPVLPLVKRLLYSSFGGNRFTRYGLQQEDVTVLEYTMWKAERGCNVNVTKMGLFISVENPCLAASTEGKVTERTTPDAAPQSGLLEIKNVLQNKPISLQTAAKTMKSFCLELVHTDLQLKHAHPYYFQVQGQLNVMEMPWLDFVVRTTNPYQMHVERIVRDVHLWRRIGPKLVAFYNEALLAELADPRHGKIPGIREPGVWFQDDKNGSGQKPPKVKASVKSKRSAVHKISEPSFQPSCSTSLGDHKSPQPSTSQSPSSSLPCSRSSRRQAKQKFVGRSIEHVWLDQGKKVWYKGFVLQVLRGRNGDPNAVYEVLYKDSDEPYEVDHLHEDFLASNKSVIFLSV